LFPTGVDPRAQPGVLDLRALKKKRAAEPAPKNL